MRKQLVNQILTGLLAVPVLVGVALSGMTNEAPTGGFVGGTAPSQTVNVPAWQDSDSRFGCTEHKSKEIHSRILVVTLENNRKVISFDNAWERTHNDNHADDVWVIGFC